MKTFMASPATIDRKWYVVDAEGKTLGRLASEVAKVLRGKNKAIFTPHIDTGDYVIVVNADKVKVTGKKLRPEDLLSSLRLYRWYERDNIKRDDEQAPRARYRVRCKGNASKGTSWTSDVYKVIRIRWTRSQTCSSEA